eukprot:gene11505-4669_t
MATKQQNGIQNDMFLNNIHCSKCQSNITNVSEKLSTITLSIQEFLNFPFLCQECEKKTTPIKKRNRKKIIGQPKKSDVGVTEEVTTTNENLNDQNMTLESNIKRTEIKTKSISNPLKELTQEKDEKIDCDRCQKSYNTNSFGCSNPKDAIKLKHKICDNCYENLNNEEEDIYCICRFSGNTSDMVECDTCKNWLHFECLGITEKQSKRIKKAKTFICSRCLDNSVLIEKEKQEEIEEEPKQLQEENVLKKPSEVQVVMSDSQKEDIMEIEQEEEKEITRFECKMCHEHFESSKNVQNSFCDTCYKNLDDNKENQFCICRRKQNDNMVECDDCQNWFHFECMNLTASQANEMDKFSCERCTNKKEEISKKTTPIKTRKVKKQVKEDEQTKDVPKEFQCKNCHKNVDEKIHKGDENYVCNSCYPGSLNNEKEDKWCSCRELSTKKMIECPDCTNWFHFSCAKLSTRDPKYFEKKENFKCERCKGINIEDTNPIVSASSIEDVTSDSKTSLEPKKTTPIKTRNKKKKKSEVPDAKPLDNLMTKETTKLLESKEVKNLNNPDGDKKWCICRNKQNAWMIVCHGCHNKYHYKCMNVTKKDVANMETFYCSLCQEVDSSRQTVYKTPEMKADDVMEVEETSKEIESPKLENEELDAPEPLVDTIKQIACNKCHKMFTDESHKTDENYICDSCYPESLNDDESDKYCYCRESGYGKVWTIQCPDCNNWFHGKCVGINKHQKTKIELFKCTRCKDIELKKLINETEDLVDDINCEEVTKEKIGDVIIDQTVTLAPQEPNLSDLFDEDPMETIFKESMEKPDEEPKDIDLATLLEELVSDSDSIDFGIISSPESTTRSVEEPESIETKEYSFQPMNVVAKEQSEIKSTVEKVDLMEVEEKEAPKVEKKKRGRKKKILDARVEPQVPETAEEETSENLKKDQLEDVRKSFECEKCHTTVKNNSHLNDKVMICDSCYPKALNNEQTDKYCYCGKSGEDVFMLHCDHCENWFHGDCVGIKETETSKIDQFICQRCQEIEFSKQIECTKCHKPFIDESHKNDENYICDSCYPESLNDDESDKYCYCRESGYGKVWTIQCPDCNNWFHGKCVGINKHQKTKIELFKFWTIQCPDCNNWFHGKCVGINKHQKTKIELFKCTRCKDIELRNDEFSKKQKAREEIVCESCLNSFKKNEVLKPQEIRTISKFYCSECRLKNPSLKITHYSIFKDLKTNGNSFSTNVKDKSKRIAPGGKVTLDHVQTGARKRQDVDYFKNKSKLIVRDSKNIKEVRNTIQDDMEYEKRKREEDNQFKRVITEKLMKKEDSCNEEEEEKPIPLNENVLAQIARLGGKYTGKPSRFYNGNIKFIPPSIQYFLDCEFDRVLVSQKFNILHLEINGEFKIKEWEEFTFLNDHPDDFILFGWGEVLLAGLQFDDSQDYEDFNVYVLDEKESVEGPYKLSEFLTEFI